MTTPHPVIASIVEGHGEEKALPVLLRRLVAHLEPGTSADIQRPYRIPRDRMLRQDVLANALTVLTTRDPAPTGVLVLLDADDDCAMDLAARLRTHARATHQHIPLVAIAAVREFEAWFLAGAAGLAGRAGLPPTLTPPAAPETIRGAKEWLSDRMPRGSTYQVTSHQPSFVTLFDLDAARAAAPSFDKFCRDLRSLLLTSPPQPSP